MFGSNESDTRSLLDDAESLITHNEYEFQRSVASLQLLVRQTEVALDNRTVTESIVANIRRVLGNIKHSLRNAHHELGDAETELNDLQTAVLALEPTQQ